MKPGSLSIVPIFAAPFALVELPGAAEANLSVAPLLARHAATHPQPTAGFCYRSQEDLLEWQEPPVRQLCSEILRGVWSAVAAVNSFTPEQLQSLSMQARGSFAIVQPNGHLPATSHSLTSWCGIYCLDAPQPCARNESGVLRLYETRLGTMFADATNSAMHPPYAPGHYAWRPVAGQLVVFPATLRYEIALIRSTGQLTLIMVRARFVGENQEGFSRW